MVGKKLTFMSGLLYEIDVRLRPSGNSGLLVTSLKAFAGYQSDKAWTWEHQALVRARVVAGCPALADRFNTVRQAILQGEGDNPELVNEVVGMRTKMRENLAENRSSEITDTMVQEDQWFDLKQDSGGIVDIEFIVQYCVLRWSQQHPELIKWTDNLRILEVLEALQLLEPNEALMLREAYLEYRHVSHRKALQNQKNRVPGDEFVTYRMAIRAIWVKLLPTGH